MRQRLLGVGLAIAWGIVATWIFWWLYATVFGTLLMAAESPVKALLTRGWSVAEIQPILNGSLAAVGALVYGLIFGVPLAFVARPPVITAWLAFVAAFLIALAVRMSLAQTPIGGLVAPLYLLTLLATLLFAVVGHRARIARANRVAA